MTTREQGPPVLAVISAPAAVGEIERVAAAVGVSVDRRTGAPDPAQWRRSRAILLDVGGVRDCLAADLPRRTGVYLVVTDDDAGGGPAQQTEAWQLAVRIGAEEVVVLPDETDRLVRGLAAPSTAAGDGAVIAVLGGRGGAGASVFAAALALGAGQDALIIDLDPLGAGTDLLLGIERADGLRWPQLRTAAGHIGADALRRALPRTGRVAVLTGGEAATEPDTGAVRAVLAAGRDFPVVICDLPRISSPSTDTVLAEADLTVVVTSADVPAAVATGRLARRLTANQITAGLVVRGPAPGGLRAQQIADSVGLPLWAAMRPQSGLDRRLDRRGLTLGRRCPLAAAAREVLGRITQPAVGP